MNNNKIVGENPKAHKMYNFVPLNSRAQHKKFNKVFCIGLNKTGTTSIHYAFQKLGLRSFHGGTYDSRIDAFSDGRYYRNFKELDEMAPNSKFILNTRDLRAWVTSRVKHCLAGHSIPDFSEDTVCDEARIRKWIEKREQHHQDVIDYFKDRPKDLLIFDLCAGDGYKVLCKFLELPKLASPFPKENVRVKVVKASNKKQQIAKRKINRKQITTSNVLPKEYQLMIDKVLNGKLENEESADQFIRTYELF